VLELRLEVGGRGKEGYIQADIPWDNFRFCGGGAYIAL
jgi:hypothetical protein